MAVIRLFDFSPAHATGYVLKESADLFSGEVILS